MPRARMKAPTVSAKFQNVKPMLPAYRYMRRGWPKSPTMCIGPNVRFTPTTISQKFHLPSVSLSMRPQILGHQ